jgi:hypothetical protein
MKDPKTLFVSAFIDLHIPHEEHKTIEMRIGNFEKLAKTGILIAVFTSKKYIDRIMDIVEKYPNVRVHKVIEIEDTHAYKLFYLYKDSLPPVRYAIKDKFEFLSLMSAKIEFMKDAMDLYGNTFEQYSWVDFNIWYIFKNDYEIAKRLWFYQTHSLKYDGVYIPGCWQKGREADLLWNRINWRFCGGFFMGKAASIRDFVDRYFNNIENIIHEKKMLTWEVNIWSYLENEHGWEPRWFNGDHNESMIGIPFNDFMTPEVDNESVLWHSNNVLKVLCQNEHSESGKYLLPPVPGFEPTSPSFLEIDGKKVLNVRFVNYTLTPQGAYIIRHRDGHLYTKNMRVFLNDDYKVNDVRMMEDKPNNIQSRHPVIEGVEDIRLFNSEGVTKFIATQREFSQENVNRMIMGDYDIHTGILTNAKVLEPPEFTGCEKNWIPIHRNRRLQFIYKWYPLQIGEIEDGGNKLVIREELSVPPIFERMRGSSTFVEFDDSLIGVIHYSEEGAPRKYFHALVWLDKDTCRPTHISETFIFNKLGIEFCIGFTIEVVGNIPFARFWFSQHDRDPMWLCIPLVMIKKYIL